MPSVKSLTYKTRELLTEKCHKNCGVTVNFIVLLEYLYFNIKTPEPKGVVLLRTQHRLHSTLASDIALQLYSAYAE